MSNRKSCLYATTLLTAVLSLMTGHAHASSGSIAYQMDYVSQFNAGLNFGEQLVVGPDNNIYVADRGNNVINVFDKSGNAVGQFGSGGNGNGQFNLGIGVNFGADGKIIVADYGNNLIQFFDPITYAFTSQVSQGSGPTYIAIDNTGNILVANNGSNDVSVFDHNGNLITQFPAGTNPLGIAIAPNGNIYVANAASNNIFVYDSSYNLINTIGSTGTAIGQFSQPDGISVDTRGNIYVADTNNARIQVFDPNGNYILSYDGSSSPSGLLMQVRSIYADVDGKIYADQISSPNVTTLQLTSTETFNGSPPGGNETASTPLSNLVLNGTGTFADNFVGYHNLSVTNGAVWTLSGINSFTGNVFIDANSGSTLTNNGTITAGSQSTINDVFNNNGTFNGSITSYSYMHNAGVINGQVDNNIIYDGNGTVSSLVNFGVVTASNPTDVIHVTNNYTNMGGEYHVVANANGQASKIVAGGTATIAGGGFVSVDADAGGVYHVNNSYVILTAAGGVSGIFAAVTSNLAFLTAALDYSNPNQITLTLTRNDGIDPFPPSVDFAPYAASGNAQAAAVALSAYSGDSFNGDTATFDAVQSLSVSDAGKLLDEVSPDEVASMPQIQNAMITSMQTPLFQRLQTAPSSSDKSSFGFVMPDNNPSGIAPDQVWLQTIGGVSNQDNSSNGVAGYRLGTVGVRGGADKDISDKTKLGLSVAYAHGTANYKGSNDSSQTQYAHADLYGRHELSNTKRNLVLEGFLGAGGGRIDSTRYITAGTLNNTIIGNTNAYDVSGAVKLSNPIRVTPSDIITPNLTTAASWTRQNGYTETGSPFALQMNSITSTPITITPMVNWQHTIQNERYGYNLTPDLGIGATWQLSELSNNVNANFAGATGTPGFTTQSAKQAPISLNLSAAVTMQPFTSNKYIPSLTAQATAQSSSTTTNTTATLTAKWDW